MSDSEGDLSSAANIPADAEIEQTIRTVVREAVKRNEDVTVKSARTSAEERLGLDAGFLKDNEQWKRKSKELISAAFDEPPSPEVPKKKAPAPKARPAPKAGTKRQSDETQESRKKQKKDVVSESDADSVLSEPDEKYEVPAKSSKSEPVSKSEDESALSDPPESEKQNGKTEVDDDESDLSSVIDDAPPKKKPQNKATAPSKSKAKPRPAANPKKPAKAKSTAADDDGDSSDLSSVIDDPPPKKGRKKKSSSPKPKAAAKPKATAANKDLSPDEEEIKRLQSWLLKCGIRKLWHRELAPFNTNKEKITHLKGMLEEVGLTGRFSAEKAKQIKEKRELAAELEAVGEFNKTWGHDEEADGSDEGGGKGKNDAEEGEKEEKPEPGKRARPKGFVDFGDSDEDSE